MAQDKPKSYLVDIERLPAAYPTHAHDPSFWESLGRTIATFGYLEETISKAIFSFTATRQYKEDEIEKAFEKWIPTLEKALTDTLRPLIDTYERSVRDHSSVAIEDFGTLFDELRKISDYRNILCHGSWRPPDSEGGSYPFYVDRKKGVFSGSFSVQSLAILQKEVTYLSCRVVNSVTGMGWQFPGSQGPGNVIWNKGPQK